MARNKRGKMALYEVMSKARGKPGFGRTLDRMRSEKVPGEGEPPIEPEEFSGPEESAADIMPEPVVRWSRKPRLVQFNAGRIEFSMSYQLLIALVLAFVLVVVVAFQAGQYYNPVPRKPADSSGQGIERAPSAPRQENTRPVKRTESATEQTVEDRGPGAAAKPTGSHMIVLVEYGRQRDLEPVQQHFAAAGIPTEIILDGGRYFLVTKDRYDNPRTAGTNGYLALQKIKEVGAKYRGKAPQGYETFAPHYFSDAYGKKAN
jgi:hypothetical protein